MLRPAAPRQGFFEAHQYEMVCKVLPDDLALVARIGYVYGWRVSSEVLTLTKAQINLEEGTLRLVAGSTKNRDGRLVYLTPELEAGITGQLARVEALAREGGGHPLAVSPPRRQAPRVAHQILSQALDAGLPSSWPRRSPAPRAAADSSSQHGPSGDSRWSRDEASWA